MPPRRADTPARVTRSTSRAPGPLPAVETKRSHAYGAKGKATLNAQVTSSRAAVDDAFADTQEMPPPPPPARAPAPEVETATRKRSPESRQEPRPAEPAVNGVAGDASAEIRPPTGVDQTSFRGQAGQAEPNRIAVFIATASNFVGTSKFWKWLAFSWLTCIAYLVSFMLLFAIVPMPTERMQAIRANWAYHTIRSVGYMANVAPPGFFESQDKFNMLHHQYIVESSAEMEAIRKNATALANTVHELSDQVGLLSDAVTEIQKVLPKYVVVIEQDGEIVIPQALWEALVAKMGSPEAAPLWDHFLEQNDAKVHDYFHGSRDTEYDGASAKNNLVTIAEFQDLLHKNNQHMEQTMNETLRAFQAVVLQQARTTAQEVVDDLFEKSQYLAKGQIGALAYTNIVYNMDRNMRETNYFSQGLGAIVQPHYTSPTWREPSVFQYLGRLTWKAIGKVIGIEQPQLAVNSKSTALKEWSENGDCWCADSPKDADIKLQIGVRTPFKVFPDKFTIEHIPSSGTRDIASAPRDYEVWIKLETKDQVKNAVRKLKERRDGHFPANCGDPPRGMNSPNDGTEDDTWFCALRQVYDIHYNNYAQTHHFPFKPWELGLDTWLVVLKVTSNWGADHTCLYRIRLAADEVEGLPYLE